ncbi:MAG: hypothetical protein WEF86_10645 [Gemmatimonadota bacterium]
MLSRYRGLLVIVLWQAPVGPGVAPDGSISFLFAAGYDEMTDFDCEGPDVSREVAYATIGLETEHDIGSHGRVEAAAGLSAAGELSHDVLFGSLRGRADWKYFGAGIGIASVPMPEGGHDPLPSLYLRVGDAERLHARGDMFPPSAFFFQQQGRAGLGWNATRRDRPAGFIGFAAVGAGGHVTGMSADLTLPLERRFSFRLTGHYAPSREFPVKGVAAGGTVLLW